MELRVTCVMGFLPDNIFTFRFRLRAITGQTDGRRQTTAIGALCLWGRGVTTQDKISKAVLKFQQTITLLEAINIRHLGLNIVVNHSALPTATSAVISFKSNKLSLKEIG